ncbi:MAG: hypothetical protein ACMVO3_22580 [Thalassobaculum sp.]
MTSRLYSQAAGPDPRGIEARYLEHIETTGRREFGITPALTNDRERLKDLHGGPPGFPGWLPRDEGGAYGFWVDWRDDSGRTRATGGALAYTTGPATFTEFVNDAHGLDAAGHTIRLEGQAATTACTIRGLVIFSGNLIVFDQADRKTDLSKWLTEITPLMNKALANARYGEPAAYVTILRDAQVNHLQPRYRLPVLVPGVRWQLPGQTEPVSAHLGVQSPAELREALRAYLR